MLSLFAVCVYILYKESSCYASSFVMGNATLPRQSRELAIGFDPNTDAILLFGGSPLPKQFVKFKNNTFIDVGEVYLSHETYSTSQHYAQINHRLWMINRGGKYIFAVNTLTYIADESTATLPTVVGQFACLASNQRYLFVVGGRNMSSITAVNIVQIYDTLNNEWLPNQANLPKMNNVRRSISCITVGSSLFAIGGWTGSIYLDSIELLDISDISLIQSQQWKYSNARLTQPLANTRAVLYDNDILVIGGWDDTSTAVSDVHIIYTQTQTCEIWDVLAMPIASAASIIVHNTLFVIGGKPIGAIKTNTYQYMTFPTAYPTTNPMVITTNTPNESTKYPTQPGALLCGANDAGSYSDGQIIFDVRMPYDGELIFDASGSNFPVTVIEIYDIFDALLGSDSDHNEVIMLQLMAGDYRIVIEGNTANGGIYHVDLDCLSVQTTDIDYKNTAQSTPMDNDNHLNILEKALYAILALTLCCCCCGIFLWKKKRKKCEIETNNIQMGNAQKDVDFERKMVASWLRHTVELPQYIHLFISQGYDNMASIQAIGGVDELREVGIQLTGHQTRILSEIMTLCEIKTLRDTDLTVKGNTRGIDTVGTGGEETTGIRGSELPLPPLPTEQSDDSDSEQSQFSRDIYDTHVTNKRNTVCGEYTTIEGH